MLIAIDTAQMTYSIATERGDYIAWHDISTSCYEQMQNLDISTITGIIINTGPGRFSGIRSGLAFAIGLARSCDIPLFTVTHTQLIAHLVYNDHVIQSDLKTKPNTTIAVTLDARKNQTYYQLFQNNHPISDIQIIHLPLSDTVLYKAPIYGNIPQSKKVQCNAKSLIDYYFSHKPAPTPLGDVQAIYIRPSVDS